MPEPTSAGITIVLSGVMITLLGPLLGPLALIVFAAIVGSALALSNAETMTKTEGCKFILVGVLLALAITSSAIWALERWLQIPSAVALMPVAVVIAAARNALLTLMDRVVNFLGDLLELLSRGKGGGP
jgi:hypothetical protein